MLLTEGQKYTSAKILPICAPRMTPYSPRAKNVLQKDPFSGHLFVFINKRRTSCKCLYYDGTGLVIVSKRMENGLFSKINPCYRKEIILTQAEFNLFFEGADLNKRFIESPSLIAKKNLPITFYYLTI